MTLAKANQATLTVIVATNPATYNTTQTLTSSGGNGTGAITYSVGSSSACSIVSGNQLKITSGTGTCSVTDTKAADTNYNQATSSPVSVTVQKATPTLSVTNIPVNAVYLGSFSPIYAYTGNGKTSVTSGSTSYCTVTSSGVVSFVGVGTNVCALTAHATATNNYLGVDSVAPTFSIGKATTTITIKNMPPPGTYKKNSGFTATYVYSGDGTPSVTSSTLSVCTVTGNSSVMFISSGTCTLTAHATAGTKYNAATGSPQSSKIMVK